MQWNFFFITVMVGWERNNKYRLCNNQEQQFMYAKEGKLFFLQSCTDAIYALSEVMGGVYFIDL